MVQENNKGLVNKINTTLVNTVPLWRNNSLDPSPSRVPAKRQS